MADCSTELKKTVPITRVVKAAIIDMHEDIGRYQELALHWAVRKLKQMERQTLKTGLKKVTIPVNQSTRTATLPPDFSSENFVGIINQYWKKVALKPNNKIPDAKNIEDIVCEDKCEKCQQDKSICNDLTITETTTLVVVGDSMQEQTVIKKLYPDGKYFLETRIPVWDFATSSVVWTVQKEFITEIDLKDCGCIDETEENIEKIRCCCPQVYDCYFSCCDTACDEDYGTYRIYEDTGMIYLDKAHKIRKVYLEYWGFLAKKNGQYQVPEVAFETLVNWVKFKKVENQKNIPLWERQWTFEQYNRENKAMKKELGRIPLSLILYYAMVAPKFDIFIPSDECDRLDTTVTTLNGYSNSETGMGPSNGNGSGNGSNGSAAGEGCDLPFTCPPASDIVSTFTPLDIAVIAGNGIGTPVPGGNTYQNDKLIGALGINFILVNETPETRIRRQWEINTVTGVLTRYQADGVTPNIWFAGDTLVVPTFFKYVNGQIISFGADPGVPTPKIYLYTADGTETGTFMVSGINGLNVWGVWRAGIFKTIVNGTPADTEQIGIGGTDLGGGRIQANGLVTLMPLDQLVWGEKLEFGYYE